MRLQEDWMAGFKNKEKAIMRISGMCGTRCLSSAYSALSLIRGVETVEISLDTGLATVTYDPEKVNVNQFPVAIGAVGLQAEPVENALA